jgi:hypothetical protein
VADQPDSDDLITPEFAEVLVTAAFPGAHVKKGTGIGRRITFNVEFGEFHLSVYTPEGANMKKDTTVVFRRTIKSKVILHEKHALTYDDAAGLAKAVKQARARVMGVFFALKSVLEPPEPERADIMGD